MQIENLKNEPYASVICYPRVDKIELNHRISELKAHRITSVEFSGKNHAFNVPILGKGFVGIVIKGYIQKKAVAIKIRRMDANRNELNQEAKMLKKANSVQVGPKFYKVSKNCLIMQYIEGNFLPIWINLCSDADKIKGVYKDLLEQCFRLDSLGLDHGELSKATKHIIINNKGQPFIIDFEAASTNRASSNVSSICQFLFLSYSKVGKVATKIFNKIETDKIIRALRTYKKEKTELNFENIMQVCRLK